MKKKFGFKIFIIVVLTIFVFLYLIIFNVKKNTKVEVQAEVSKIGTNYVIVVDKDDNEYLLNTSEQYNIGDKVNIVLKNLKKGSPCTGEIIKIDTVSRNVVFTITDEVKVNEEEKSEVVQNTEVKEPINNSITNNENVISNDEKVVTYFANFSNEIDNSNSFKGNIKEKFVSVVDFLFYDGVISGVTFDELTNSTKLKLLELVLKIDQKLEGKFPGYKASISENSGKVYTNIKDKVITLYFDITASVCADNGDLCESAKEGLGELKKSFSLTWDFIKNAAGSGLEKLKSWYEIWREV